MDDALIIECYKKGMSLRQIAKEFHIDRKRCSKILKANNIQIRDTSITSRKYNCNHNYFETIDCPEKAYWIGFLAADGFIESKRINGAQKLGVTLSKKDEAHLHLFNQMLDSDYEIKTYVGSGYNPEGEYSKLLITSQKLVDDLRKYGIVENKTSILMFPKNLPQEYYNDYMRGYFDGDGSIYYQSNGQYGISFTGTYNVLKTIKTLCGLNVKIREAGNGVYEMSANSSFNAYRVCCQMYYDENCVKLDRKYEKFLELKKYVERQGIQIG